MDIEQAGKTLQWLDDERRKDKQEITALQERVLVLTTENSGLQRRLQELENNLLAVSNTVQRVARIDAILDGYRKEMQRQLDELERRRAEAGKEEERLRKIERDATAKTLAELRKHIELLPRLEREMTGRKDEESRVARLIAELQLKVAEFNKHVDERNRAVTVIDEGRRQDVKRIVELQTESADLRKRIDDSRGKLEILEDMIRRTDARLVEIFQGENERRQAQAQWVEAQSVALAASERAFAELKSNTSAALNEMQDYARRVEQYAEAFRDMRRIADEARAVVDVIDRRVTETTEVHRLTEDRIRQDWASFLADDQKRWTTHMLLRDEQWREHDRLGAKQTERLTEVEEQLEELASAVRQVQAQDANRMQTLLNVVRELAAEYDPNFVKVR